MIEDHQKHLVSIIISTTIGTRLDNLKSAIRSALDQDYLNIEIIVVYDGEDELERLVDEFNNRKIVYIKSDTCRNPILAREIAIDKSKGSLICFLDNNNILYRNHVSTLVQYSNPRIIPFAKAKYILSYPGSPDLETFHLVHSESHGLDYKPNDIYQHNIAPMSRFLIRKEMHYEIGGFDKNLFRLEDWDYWGRMSLNYELKLVDVVTVEIRIDFSKLSRKFSFDVFKDTNGVIGERIKDRLNFMRRKGKFVLDDEVREAVRIPKVSVIMPIYNAQKFLKEAIDSILNQTFRDFELLLINDGSTDNSKKIIEQYRCNNRIRIFHKKNEGVTRTLNFGLVNAIGKYIARMDADDISMPDRLQLQVKFMDEHRDVGLLGTRFKAYTDDGKFLGDLDVELSNEELQQNLLQSCRFGHPTIMIRRCVLEVVGLYDESPWAYTVEDYDLWLRIAEMFVIANHPNYLLHYRVNPQSITQSKMAINQKGTKECINRAKFRRNIKSGPLVSICIPVFGQAEFLRRAIESILTQSYVNYEVIIIDDFPDDSVDKIYEYYKENGKVQYHKNIARKRLPEIWNQAMQYAKGKYVKILHLDHWFSNDDSLLKFVEMLEFNPGADFAFSSWLHFSSPWNMDYNIHRPNSSQIDKVRNDPQILLIGNFIGAPSATIFRRSAMGFFDNHFKWLSDIDYYIRMIQNNNQFAFTYEPLIAGITSPTCQVDDNNKSFMLSEYLRLYQKINNECYMTVYQFRYLWDLIEKYKIRSVQDIINYNQSGEFPSWTELIIWFIKVMTINNPALLLKKIIKYDHLFLDWVQLIWRKLIFIAAYCLIYIKHCMSR